MRITQAHAIVRGGKLTMLRLEGVKDGKVQAVDVQLTSVKAGPDEVGDTGYVANVEGLFVLTPEERQAWLKYVEAAEAWQRYARESDSQAAMPDDIEPPEFL